MYAATYLLLAYVQAAFAIANISSDGNSVSTCSAALLSVDQVRERVLSGRVYVHDDFLTEAQSKLLQRDMQQLDREGKFIVNGLSDVRKGLKGETASESTSKANQGFDVKYDRSVCPIPWWQQSLALSDDHSDVDECANDGVQPQNEATLSSIQTKLQMLRRDLANILHRPTMLDSSLGHECYYSKSNPGSSLARHMDERHEEFKGPRGWLLPSRRSLSWLIYLSETEAAGYRNNNNNIAWDAEQNGGMLRIFPQRRYRPSGDKGWQDTVQCGSHDGNLQVGWLLAHDESGGSSTHPVFLNCWFQYMNPYTNEIEPHNVLYIVRNSRSNVANFSTSNETKERIEYITVPWISDAVGGNVMDFLQHRSLLESNPDHSSERLFLERTYATQFKMLEDREAWDRGEDPDGSIVEDILPKRGRLVVFDSVTLPHEVTAVIKGSRSALAGWFHEETQPMGG